MTGSISCVSVKVATPRRERKAAKADDAGDAGPLFDAAEDEQEEAADG